MSTLAQTLVALLKADPTITALVAARIYRNRMPKTATIPVIVFQRISTGHDYTMSGPGSIYPYWQITCWASTSDSADSIANAVENVINRNGMFAEGRTDGLEQATDLNFVRLDTSSIASKE